TATSAVCVTGLVTVDTSTFTRFGQIVILALIQIGGLGIISFTSIMLVLPGRRLPFRRLRTIRSFSVEGVESDPVRIVRGIVVSILLIEGLGALILYSLFTRAGVPDALFAAVFHSISAFCNAGFSTFPDSLVRFQRYPVVLAVVSALIVAGGIGFIVLQDLARRVRGRKRSLSYHARLMLWITAVLILAGAAAYFFLEGQAAFLGMDPLDRAANAVFQSVTPRTAGFNAVPQTALTQPSRFLTILLMFIGGAPGSIAGGVKLATAYVVLMVMLTKANEKGEINAFGRRLTPEIINSAVAYFIKSAFLLVIASGLLSISEASRGADLGRIVFEVTSALGTVGLSLDFTSGLSTAGKLVIIATMFIGRVGLLAILFLGGGARARARVYPRAGILIG
ncbi:MAG TPA: potassium transporter TrkG, partial [Magnetospirillaceae bacterium]|nr:potassium transporter TrkG [Magnetospirillaceae bacterium]